MRRSVQACGSPREGTVVDGTQAGLLADRAENGARLLAYLDAGLGGSAAAPAASVEAQP